MKRALYLIPLAAILAAGCAKGEDSTASTTPSDGSSTSSAAPEKTSKRRGETGFGPTQAGQNADSRFGTAGQR